MNEDEKKIDQSQLAESIAKSIPYEFYDMFLVKPLDPVKVKKEFSKPVTNDVPKKDANGIEAQDFDEVETEVKEVDSNYRKGVIIKVPTSYKAQLEDPDLSKYIRLEYKPGMIVLFKDTCGSTFDLVRDTRLLKTYEIVGIEA